MRIAPSPHDLEKFREETRAASSFSLERVPLNAQSDWAVRCGALSHRSRGFFHVAGARNDASGEERLVLHQPQAAITCLAIHVDQGRPHVLTQARPEPGNGDQVQYGPTIQSTPANYLGLHGGRPVPHLDCFIDCVPGKARPLAQSSQLDLGNRYFQKIKTLMYVEAHDWLETGHDLVWAPLDSLLACMEHDHFLNIDFRAMLACFDWDGWQAGAPGAAHPLAASRHGGPALSSAPAQGDTGFRLVGLDTLRRWRVTSHGVEPLDRGQPGVGIYHSVCEGREKASWYQPLYEAPGLGEVTLYLRRREEGFELLLSRVEDTGVAGGSAWTSSVDRAPESAPTPSEPPAPPVKEGALRRSMLLSEEGGRFLWNTNRYRIVEVKGDLDAAPGQAWVGLPALKAILLGSNLATIHLRCAASLILDLLYPKTFA